MISVIIPTYQEEAFLGQILAKLHHESSVSEIIVVDGGSRDRTVEIARSQAKVILSKKGRGVQLNEGAQCAKGDILFFLHADSWVETGAFQAIIETIQQGNVGGCLTQRIQDSHTLFRWIEWTGNIRARRRKIFFGDQGIFVRKDIFLELGGFQPIPLFEDVRFSRKLRNKGQTVVLPHRLWCSNRRWVKQGILKTTVINRILLTLFYFGVSEDLLCKWYQDIR